MAGSLENMSLREIVRRAITNKAEDYIIARKFGRTGRVLFSSWLRLYFRILERLQSDNHRSLVAVRDWSHSFLYHISEIIPFIEDKDQKLVQEVYLFCLAWCNYIDPTNHDFKRSDLRNHLSIINTRVWELKINEDDRLYLLGLIEDVIEGREPRWIEDTSS